MHLKSGILFFALCASSAASSACRCAKYEFLSIPRANLSQPQQNQSCVSYQLIDARGTLEPQGVSLMFELAFERILANVTNAIRHSVVYPAALDQNVTSGSVYLRQHIENSLVKCPEQKYLLYGYSQGASLVLDSLGKLCPKAAEAIASVTLIGNPFRVPHRLSNVNREGHYDNRISFGRFANQAHKNNASIPMLSDTLDRSGRALDICLDNDTLCAFDPDCSCPIDADHLSYGMVAEVQDIMVKHALAHMG